MAVVQTPGLAQIVERDVPEPGPTQVLIAIRAASICGSDLHLYKGKHPSASLPVSLGHELAGDVIRVGSKVNSVSIGDRVTVEPVIACGACPSCARGEYGYCDHLSFHYRKGQGAIAEYFVADERYVYKLPDEMAYEAAALIEPLAVAVHAVRRARIGLGDKGRSNWNPGGRGVQSNRRAGDHHFGRGGSTATDGFGNGRYPGNQFIAGIGRRCGSSIDRWSRHRQVL